MTRHSKGPEVQRSLEEFTQQMIASRQASKEATRRIYEARTKVCSAAKFISLAAQEFEKVGESAMATALSNSILSLSNEQNYLDKLLDLIGCE